MNALELIEKNHIVTHVSGSHAYGTNVETSDLDIRGIFCGDPVNIRTPFFIVREGVVEDQEDTKFYELSHFMKLYLDCNPNIVESLWVNDKSILKTSAAYKYMAIYRQSLLSSKAAFTFTGYAFAQLKRIKGHNKWINNPQPKEIPSAKDYFSLLHNFREEKLFNADFTLPLNDHMLIHFGSNVYGIYQKKGSRTCDESGALVVNNEQKKEELGLPAFFVMFKADKFKEDKENWKNYWEWKKKRNKKRNELEEKFGYDSKHAMHLVRLLRMGEEILKDGVVNVFRKDADELLSVRDGKWPYDELLKYAEDMERKIKVLYNKTDLPKKPDVKLAAEVMMNIQDVVWSA